MEDMDITEGKDITNGKFACILEELGRAGKTFDRIFTLTGKPQRERRAVEIVVWNELLRR